MVLLIFIQFISKINGIVYEAKASEGCSEPPASEANKSDTRQDPLL